MRPRPGFAGAVRVPLGRVEVVDPGFCGAALQAQRLYQGERVERQHRLLATADPRGEFCPACLERGPVALQQAKKEAQALQIVGIGLQ